MKTGATLKSAIHEKCMFFLGKTMIFDVRRLQRGNDKSQARTCFCMRKLSIFYPENSQKSIKNREKVKVRRRIAKSTGFGPKFGRCLLQVGHGPKIEKMVLEKF